MRGSDADWPAPDAPHPDGGAGRTGGSRMLLDELLACRDQPEPAPTSNPPLTIEPVAVPLASEPGRRGARQRLHQLEDVARRNLRSAEEAREALFAEHERLIQESTARAAVQRDAAALRRELDRLRAHEEQREAQAKHRAARAARAEIAEEIKRFHEEHDRVVHELDRLRGALTDHDGLMEEYGVRLREEQQARAALRAELDRAEAAQRLAELALERAMETARQRAEDELIQLATAQSELADVKSDRDRLAARLAELSASDQAARLAELEARVAEADAELVRARADGDRLRAHAAALGDELAALRARVAELQAAAPAPIPTPLAASEDSSDESSATAAPERPPLDRRRPREERPAASSLPMRRARRAQPATATAPPATAPPAPTTAAASVAPPPAGESAPADRPPLEQRRRVMAEFSALASSSNDPH